MFIISTPQMFLPLGKLCYFVGALIMKCPNTVELLQNPSLIKFNSIYSLHAFPWVHKLLHYCYTIPLDSPLKKHCTTSCFCEMTRNYYDCSFLLHSVKAERDYMINDVSKSVKLFHVEAAFVGGNKGRKKKQKLALIKFRSFVALSSVSK